MKICKEAAKNPKAYVTECRIMRKKLSNNSGGKIKLGASKGYAFVEFKNHEDALACLKKLNNNPEIFKKDRVRCFYLPFSVYYFYFSALLSNFRSKIVPHFEFVNKELSKISKNRRKNRMLIIKRRLKKRRKL